MYVKQHNVKGLAPRYLGPFPVTSRPSRSTIVIKVGLDAKGLDRLELRHISDIKVAYLRNDANIAERPKRGRPPKKVEDVRDTESSHSTSLSNKCKQNKIDIEPQPLKPESNISGYDSDAEPFHGFQTQPVNAINFSKQPKPFSRRENLNYFNVPPQPFESVSHIPWSASAKEISEINLSINKSRGSWEKTTILG